MGVPVDEAVVELNTQMKKWNLWIQQITFPGFTETGLNCCLCKYAKKNNQKCVKHS